jgi:UDP-N-acetyl-D-mannosaminuronate dehydrogenase
LIDTADNLDVKLRLAPLARQVNEGMVKHAIGLTQNALQSCGRSFRRAKVTIIGSTGSGTSGETFGKILEAKGAKISLYDPLLSMNETTNGAEVPKRNLNDAIEGSDCIVILDPHEPLRRMNLKSLRAVMRSPSAIVDLVGTLKPEKVEIEGFIYRRLGRGTAKK